MPYSVALIDGLTVNGYRTVAFLRSSDDSAVDAYAAFEALNPKASNEMRSRFDYWIGGGHKDNYFHGWPNDQNRKECFVFKRKQGRTHCRYYGFLINPRPNTAPRYQVCVLVSYATKNSEHTDPTEINAVNALRGMPQIIAAVKTAFPEPKK
jgi:hypothetical protein